MRSQKYREGDRVVYCLTKRSATPGPRAKNIDPEVHGDAYTYRVDKYWVVADVLDGDRLLLQTRRGKTHEITASDPNLRHANWWERILRHHRFPLLAVEPQAGSAKNSA